MDADVIVVGAGPAGACAAKFLAEAGAAVVLVDAARFPREKCGGGWLNARALKQFLFENMYRHYKLNRMTSKARRVVQDLFELLVAEPNCLPTTWRERAGAPGTEETARLVCDYIAGITDRFALDEHKKLFDVQARAS